MARETALWQRLKAAGKRMRAAGRKLHMERIENSAGAGIPDVDYILEGSPTIWLELKTCLRPKRETTPLKLLCRQSQCDWHNARTDAGGRTHYILIQVGESYSSALYLVPGWLYERLMEPCTEGELLRLSVSNPSPGPEKIIVRASGGW
jgi:hypothetical protein